MFFLLQYLPIYKRSIDLDTKMLRRALESLTEQGRQKLEFGEGPVEGTMENSIVFQLGKQRAMYECS